MSRNGFRYNDRTVHGGLVAATAALPRWAALTGRNAELLEYLERDLSMRRFGVASTSCRSPSPSKKENVK